jgi:hypothetical protein
MLTKRILTSACAATAMFIATTPAAARAQGGPLDSRTEFTFNTPVEMPGVTLPPGTYVFRFVDATSSRKVMQVQAKDSTSKTYGLFLTISAQRPKASDDAELRFLETPAGAPAAVKTWWYPGQTIGREFIYPKSQARKLAQATNTNVLTTHADTVSDDQMKTADLAYMAPSGQETAVSDDQLVSAAANTAPVGGNSTANSNNTANSTANNSANNSTSSNTANGNSSSSSMPVGTSGMNSGSNSSRNSAAAGNQQAVRVGQNASNSTRRSRLPKTSTVLPLMGLMGVSSLLGGVFRSRR